MARPPAACGVFPAHKGAFVVPFTMYSPTNWSLPNIDHNSYAFYSLYMADSGNFDKLVSSLSLDERQTLLSKLKGQSNMSSEPLYFDEELIFPLSDIETQYNELPWYYRLWYFILSLFKSKAPLKIFEDHQVYTLGSKAEERSPGLYDYQRGLLLPAFCHQIEKLKESARFFYSALDISVNRDKGAFFAFLGSLEMADVHKRLQTETEPLRVIEKNPDMPEMELRQAAVKAMEDAFIMITDDYRNAMYGNARSLNCLRELSSFLFDRIIMGFAHNPAIGGETCSASIVKELLLTLNNILLSLKVVPPMPLLESLFVFSLQDKAGDQGFDINRDIRGLLAKAEDSLNFIRDFNKRVPLTWIIRCSTRDMTYSPRVISGGEDWFVVYRDYWRKRIDSLFNNYMRERRQKELLNTFRYFLKGNSLKILENTQSDAEPDGMPIKGAYALSFLLSFYSAVFMPDINRYLRSILIDGEFHEKENRAEFAESYNNLIKLEDDIKKLERDISPVGDYGKRYTQARQDISSLPVKRRKIQIVLEDVSDNAARIIERTREATRRIVKILNGILGRDPRGKFFSLTNLAKVAGRDTQFVAGLEEAIQLFQRMLKILDDIDLIEYGR